MGHLDRTIIERRHLLPLAECVLFVTIRRLYGAKSLLPSGPSGTNRLMKMHGKKRQSIRILLKTVRYQERKLIKNYFYAYDLSVIAGKKWTNPSVLFRWRNKFHPQFPKMI